VVSGQCLVVASRETKERSGGVIEWRGVFIGGFANLLICREDVERALLFRGLPFDRLRDHFVARCAPCNDRIAAVFEGGLLFKWRRAEVCLQ